MQPKKYALYQDVNRLVPIVGNGVYTANSALVSRIYYNQAKQLRSDQKISPLTTPSPRVPYYEIAERLIKLRPSTYYGDQYIATEIVCDYVSRPDIEIDVLNATINYSLYFPEKFLNRLVVQAAFVFTSQMAKDDQLANALAVDATINP